MRKIDVNLCIVLCFLSIAHGSDLEKLESFVGDIIATWQLLSPTIIVQDDLLKLCQESQWVLCLSDSMDTNELALHMDIIHQQRKQDGVIFVGSAGHEKLVKQLEPSIFSSNCPVFMPNEYTKDIKLRLDSNLIFYNLTALGKYELIDKFAVKGGPPITDVLGYWEIGNGITFLKGLNRWDRRMDLNGATLNNCATEFAWASGLIKDKSGSIIGSKGYYPEKLFIITDGLNLIVETVECPWNSELLKNGSWIGDIGLLQRREVDVLSTGIAINLQRSHYIDYPLPTYRGPLTLIAAIPKGSSPDMWVYVDVFGVYQWIIFISLLVFTVMGLSLFNYVTGDKNGMKFGSKRGTSKDYKLSSPYSGFALACLFTIQMGSHINSKQFVPRLLTLTLSFLTLLFFVYYTTDITAEMTSGPPELPIRTFEDVVYHNYRVIASTPYTEWVLASAKHGSAKREVYDQHFERKHTESQGFIEGWMEIMNKVINDPKTLYYESVGFIIPITPQQKALSDQVFDLKMDDAVYTTNTLPLQKDSEFLPIFNHRILKMIESGLLRKLYLKYFADLYVKENFEMSEPQALGYNNVMFPFIFLGVGIALSIVKAITEFMIMKLIANKQNKLATSKRIL